MPSQCGCVVVLILSSGMPYRLTNVADVIQDHAQRSGTKHQCYLGLCWLGIPLMIAKAKTPRAAHCFLLTHCHAKAGLTWLRANGYLCGSIYVVMIR